MFNASLYHTANSLQRRDATDVLDQYLQLVKWRKDGRDVLLDVGCGDGDVAVNILLKRIPTGYGSLTGGDLSSEMIDYATNLYANDKINFVTMDVSTSARPEHINKYDHIFSFNCLHWVQDQTSALRTIYHMLKDTGDCVITFLAKNHIFDVWKLMAQNPKWEPYMRNHNVYISPYNSSLNPSADFKKLLLSVGFEDVQVAIKHKSHSFYGIKNLRDSAAAVNPFFKNIPKDLHEEYLDEYVKYVGELGFLEENNNNFDDKKFIITTIYSSLIAYASKR